MNLSKTIKLAGLEVDTSKLLTRQELIAFIEENGGSDRALSQVRERYQSEFGNELVWSYPISDGKHAGTHIVTVREGFISLPYDTVDKDEYEIYELDDAALFDEEALLYFIDDWKLFSDDLMSALEAMRGIVGGCNQLNQ